MSIPLVFIHGYSDSAMGFKEWRKVLLQKRNLNPSGVHLINYTSLTNEVTIRDIAEGFNRALLHEAGIAETEPFDVIVHSTGMLVIRAWLTRYASMDDIKTSQILDKERIKRVRHLIALAPATNGSPVAHKGRSWLGALVKGNRDFGPDFLESGHQVLSALELASPFTWDLAAQDMFGSGNTSRFKAGRDSPFVFTICGDSGLGKAADMATGAVGTKIKGSDGVVRWAGAALNSRLLSIDYTGERVAARVDNEHKEPAISPSEWNNQNNILILWPGFNHGTIMRPNQTDPLVSLVSEALDVNSDDDFNLWNKKAKDLAQSLRGTKEKPHEWQQLVIRVCDERGDGVTDWTISLQKKMKNESKYQPIEIDDLHPFEKNKSFRCLHINLTECRLSSLDKAHIENVESLEMKLTMNTSSDYLLYMAQRKDPAKSSRRVIKGLSELTVELKDFLYPNDGGFNLLMPYTTTYVEFKVNRDPSLDGKGRAKLCYVQ